MVKLEQISALPIQNLRFSGEKSANPKVGRYYNPEQAEKLSKIREITADGKRLISECYNSDHRVRTYSVRLLEMHADYAEMFADAMSAKALGKDEEANALLNKFRVEIGKREVYFE